MFNDILNAHYLNLCRVTDMHPGDFTKEEVKEIFRMLIEAIAEEYNNKVNINENK